MGENTDEFEYRRNANGGAVNGRGNQRCGPGKTQEYATIAPSSPAESNRSPVGTPFCVNHPSFIQFALENHIRKYNTFNNILKLHYSALFSDHLKTQFSTPAIEKFYSDNLPRLLAPKFSNVYSGGSLICEFSQKLEEILFMFTSCPKQPEKK